MAEGLRFRGCGYRENPGNGCDELGGNKVGLAVRCDISEPLAAEETVSSAISMCRFQSTDPTNDDQYEANRVSHQSFATTRVVLRAVGVVDYQESETIRVEGSSTLHARKCLDIVACKGSICAVALLISNLLLEQRARVRSSRHPANRSIGSKLKRSSPKLTASISQADATANAVTKGPTPVTSLS